jgi:hypothetical protein
MHAFAISLAFTLAMETNVEGQLLAYPPREVVKAQAEFQNDFTIFLEHDFIDFDSPALLLWRKAHLRYVQWSHDIWKCLCKAQNKTKPILERLDALSELRGELLTTQGRMPPIVAYWCFREGPPPPQTEAIGLDEPPPAPLPKRKTPMAG